MENRNLGESPLWTYINQTQITKEKILDLTNFKSTEVNFKIALWNPQMNGMRYLKTLIYNLCAQLTSDAWIRLRRIHNREIGNPITVKYDGELVCMDYLQAVFELEFMTNQIHLDGTSILEIGAGYGRTCHAILSNCEVAAYYVVDLENCLELTRRYLNTVLDKEQFEKVHFVTIGDVDRLGATHFDLCVNIDSFAEMDGETVKSYLTFIDKRCHYFYVKNPVGKYLDKSLDNESQGNEIAALALNTGLLREIIDIHDNRVVAIQADKFVAAYRPSESWTCLANDWAGPWSYYWQAVYHKRRVGVGNFDANK